ncbi:hypothetical protein B0T16DRAFT_398665 [Cercophora newfieldiana]|uniref:Mucin n=1 Tax=Cercophora newfieldiana TaxID=92897 RepID=A0AA39YP52_9PEZI|nr:hypothetical protein B0T16DRAFT_398665 [Cercophora newfieldiana]
MEGTAGAITASELSLVTASGSEIGGLGHAPKHDGAISSTATCPATANRVASLDAPVALDSLLDSNGTSWDRLLPWLLTTPGLRGSLGSLIPQTSPSFDLVSDLSIRLPFFTNTNTKTQTAASDGQLEPNRPHLDTGRDRTASLPDDCRTPYKSFYFSPSVSTSSLASSSAWASEGPSREEATTMPGQIIERRAGAPAALPVPEEYFARPSACAAADTTTTNDAQWRPHSARSGRPASPVFARWARRHHYHSQRQHSGQMRPRTSTESKVSGSSSAVVKQSPARSRSSSIQKRQSHIGGVPQMTREEFEALPLAIQRKYFSTLERLRFARDSGHVDGISQHYDDISHFKPRKPRQGRSVSEQITSRIARRSSLLEARLQSPDSSPSCTSFPDAAHKREYSREEQVVLARRLRASVILDAADEAICKLNRRASKKIIRDSAPVSPCLSSRRESMDSHVGSGSHTDRTDDREIPQSFYDTFRWLEEEDDLDLRLFLDDYHANLRDNIPSPTKQQRPSFRRHLSITKIPFGRNSVSISRPATKDATTPTSPLHSPAGSVAHGTAHTRRKSRALSLITPRHAAQDSVSTFDPSAAHYQDPEARLKLRVYLASPQKFDEAIEFGFPSADVLSAAPAVGKDGAFLHQSHARQKLSDGSSNMRTFLADDDEDDNISLDGDQISLGDPESPRTPQAVDSKPGAIRPLRVSPNDVVSSSKETNRNVSEGGGYAQAPASSREMTLRMTLTRPDLRAHEEQIYGWQQKQGLQQGSRRSTAVSPAMESTTYIGDMAHKESMDRGASFDWSSTTADKGVMKRFWNRVRRG